MTNKQQGFTLIELVAVIVILGALAVVALPRFIDLQDEAEQAAAEGVAGAVSAAFATNFAGSLAKEEGDGVAWGATGSPTSSDKFVWANDVSDISASDIDSNLMQGTPLVDGGYTVDASGGGTCDIPSNEGESVQCQINNDDLDSAVSFTVTATRADPNPSNP